MGEPSRAEANFLDRALGGFLRITLGLILVLAAITKISGLGADALHGTTLHQLVAGRAELIVALALLEFIAGTALVLDLFTRPLAITLAAAVAVGTVVLLFGESEGGRGCGCFGAMDRGFMDRGIGLVARNAVLFLALLCLPRRIHVRLNARIGC